MKKYDVIYADPPWQLTAGSPIGKYSVEDGKQVWKNASNKSRELSYKSLTVEEIKAMPVKTLSNENSCLYVWVVNKYLPDVFDVIKSWGFKYSTTIVWCKNMMGGGLGGTHKINTEFLIYATRGKVVCNNKSWSTWHNVKRDYENGFPKHSKKPEYFRGIIDSIHPGSKIELFARKKVFGWDAFGNEVEDSIKIAV